MQRQPRNRAAELAQQIGDNLKSIQPGFDSGFGRMIAQRVDPAQTPQGYIEQQYQRLRSQYQQDPALRGRESGAKLARVLDALADARDREVKAVN